MRERLPQVAIVGGVDVHARLPLMERLRDEFELIAYGVGPGERFAGTGFGYRAYAADQAARVSPFDDARAFASLVRLFRAERPAIVHAFDTKAGVWGCLAARVAGVPSAICTVNGVGFLFRRRTPREHLVSAAYQWLQRLACRASRATVFQNPDDAERFVALGITPRERVVLVPGSGVETARLDPARYPAADREALRASLGIAPGELMVVMVTRVIRSKGVLDLLDAARIVRKQHPNVRFVLVGADEPESMDRLTPEELEELRTDLCWVGPRADVPALLAASDVMAFPSAYGEGIPRVLLEAASMALPIVTTDTPGCREVVEPGQTGLRVGVGDPIALAEAIASLARDPALRARFGAAARARARERFDLAVVSETTRQLYRELLDHGTARTLVLGSVA